MAGIPREDWLARRASPSLGRLLRQRFRFIHVSKTPEQCKANRTFALGCFGSRRAVPGNSLILGRNAAKRELRKGRRKFWRVLPK